MVRLNFPDVEVKIRNVNEALEVFDPLRKRFVSLTPEEWVRQHLISYLINHLEVPVHMMASERGLVVNTLKKRFDLVVYHPNGNPLMIAECKAPSVKLTEDTFYQAAGYNLALKVKYLLITNGLVHHCIKLEENTPNFQFLNNIPSYSEMKR